MQADWMCLLANTSEGKAHENKSLIVVPMDTPGVVRAKKIEKIGMHASDTAVIYFEDVRVPLANTIGEEGMGFVYQMLQFQQERLAGAVGALVPLETAIQETVEYCRERRAFGQPLLDNQYIHYRCRNSTNSGKNSYTTPLVSLAGCGEKEGHEMVALSGDQHA